MVLFKFSFQDWAQYVRQPIFIAGVASVGLHGVLLGTTPLLSEVIDDEQQEPESVGVVALSPEELSRLPDFAQNDALNLNNFGSPLVTEDGLSPLPVPGTAPLGEEDFSAFDGGLLDLLPPTSLGSPPFDGGLTDSFDYDDGSFSSTFDGGSDFDPNEFGSVFDEGAVFDDGGNELGTEGLISSEEVAALPAPEANAGDIFSEEKNLCPPQEEVLDPFSPPTDVSPEALDCIPRDDTSPDPNAIASSDAASQEDLNQPENLNPNEEGGEDENADGGGEADPPVPPAPTISSAAEFNKELRARIRKYRPDETAALGAEEREDRVREAQASLIPPDFFEKFDYRRELPPALNPLALVLPEDIPSDFCASNVQPAQFLVQSPVGGVTTESIQTVIGTGYPALDEIAIQQLLAVPEFEPAQDEASRIPLYEINVVFQDGPESRCNVS